MSLPCPSEAANSQDSDPLMANPKRATAFLKALAHEGRLTILSRLATGEKSVTELEALLSSRQAAVSQQLARLRMEGLVKHRRQGQTIYYSLKDQNAVRVLKLLDDIFLSDTTASG
ncbi:MAG: metalloregulator ArsR/SmtB family transcription factor [Alphaproteobacteria bacterium]|nr:metalloregulator ArsR/SmtB family transcription factor [Alphaproteobacteria bacterium]